MPFKLTATIPKSVPRVSSTGTPVLSPKGSPSERLWVIAEAPLPRDADKGFLFSSAMGWSYDKMLGEMGISRYYVTYLPPSGDRNTFLDFINRYMPPIIVCLDASAKIFFNFFDTPTAVGKYAGSLLQSDELSYPHYIIPTHGPELCVRDWTERQVVKFIDFGKVRDELDYWKENGELRPLPEKMLVTDLDEDFPRLLDKLGRWTQGLTEPISVDVEAVYPKGDSEFIGHPGYAITVGIAPNPNYGISFELFRESTRETALLWKALGELLWSKDIIGQNFHSFDAWHFQMLGMPVNRMRIKDTMHMHAVLWPELPHKLQFLTRQYTRQPYYKDEGHHWSPKDMKRLKRYNALDVVTTYEVYLAMLEEANGRPHLI